MLSANGDVVKVRAETDGSDISEKANSTVLRLEEVPLRVFIKPERRISFYLMMSENTTLLTSVLPQRGS